MSIDIRHIAKLSHLKIEDEKFAKFEKDMKSIVAMVERLPDNIDDEILLDSSNTMTLREDIAVSDKFTRDELMANAPEVKDNCFAVPKTVS